MHRLVLPPNNACQVAEEVEALMRKYGKAKFSELLDQFRDQYEGEARRQRDWDRARQQALAHAVPDPATYTSCPASPPGPVDQFVCECDRVHWSPVDECGAEEDGCSQGSLTRSKIVQWWAPEKFASAKRPSVSVPLPPPDEEPTAAAKCAGLVAVWEVELKKRLTPTVEISLVADDRVDDEKVDLDQLDADLVFNILRSRVGQLQDGDYRVIGTWVWEVEEALENAPPATQTRKKRSTVRGEARLKLIAALTKHHEYADGGSLNTEPIGNNKLAELAGVDSASASRFIKKEFGGPTSYQTVCRDPGRLAECLKILNGEFSPHNLYGRCPPGERELDDE